MRRLGLLLLVVMLVLAACESLNPVTPTPSPQVISKLIATVYISPTPNAEQAEATRRASTPTPRPVTPTVIPSATPFIGTFIGRAERDVGFPVITRPLLAPDVVGLADPTQCDVPIATAFVNIWQLDPAVSGQLGCPIQQTFGFFGQLQVFETGVMYLQPETRGVWALAPEQNQYWYVEAPEAISTVGVQAVPGLVIPGGDFGSLWLGVDAVRDELGYAVTGEQDAEINLQRFENGTMLWDDSSGQLFGLVVDGTLLGPFSAPETPTDVTPVSDDGGLSVTNRSEP